MKATQEPNGFALATSAAALFAAAALPGCATPSSQEQAIQNTEPSAFQEQYPGPKRPCFANVCGGHSDCK